MEENQKQAKGDYDFINVALEQWKTCANLANSISSRRDNINNLFVTLNLALIAATSAIHSLMSLIVSIVGVAFCIVWHYSITYYRNLNKAKFSVILEIEESLPFQAFKKEEEIYNKGKKFHEGTVLEKFLPIIFILGYCAITLIGLLDSLF